MSTPRESPRFTASLFILTLITASLFSSLLVSPAKAAPLSEPESVADIALHPDTAVSTPPNVVPLADGAPEIDAESKAYTQFWKRSQPSPYTHYWKRQDEVAPAPKNTHYWKRQDEAEPTRTHYWKRTATVAPTSSSMAPVAPIAPLPDSLATSTTTPPTNAITPSVSPTTTSTNVIAPAATPEPDTIGDVNLLGKPMVIGAYNLTLSIVVNSIITLCFCIMIAFATYKRAQWRKTYREEVAKAGEVKRAPKPEKKDASKSEKASSDSKPLMNNVGPVGMRAPKENTWTPSEASNPVPRNYQGQGQSQLYEGAGIGGNASSGGAQVARSNSSRYPGGPVGGSRELYEDPLTRYRDDSVDMTDYSRPPLTASTTTDPYYPGRFDTTQTYDEYPSSQGVRAAYQDPRPLQPVAKRSNSSTATGTAYRGGLERSAPPLRLATLGLSGSGPSSRSSSGSNTPSPVDRYGRRGANSPVAPIEMEQYPAKITRSSSNRIPPQMRGGYV